MISVVVVNWNSGPLLERCVISLLEHAAGCELIVVDNASTDASLLFTKRLGSRVSLLRMEKNGGFAAACNAGWRSGGGGFVLFLNPDTEAPAGSVAAMRDLLAGDERVWAVAGRLVGSAGRPQAGFNIRSFPSLGSVSAEMLLLDEVWPRNPWTRRYRLADFDYGAIGEAEQPAAACLMVRRQALERLDGFDESFRPAWFEDVDLCRRIRNAGGRILYQPGAPFLHHGGVSLSSLAPEDFLRYYHTNQIRYFAKHHGRRAARRVRRLVVAGMILRALASFCGLAKGPAGAYWRTARHFRKSREVHA